MLGFEFRGLGLAFGRTHMGVPKLGINFGVPILRILVYWGLCWVPLLRETTIFGKPVCVFSPLLAFSGRKKRGLLFATRERERERE